MILAGAVGPPRRFKRAESFIQYIETSARQAALPVKDCKGLQNKGRRKWRRSGSHLYQDILLRARARARARLVQGLCFERAYEGRLCFEMGFLEMASVEVPALDPPKACESTDDRHLEESSS
jgi:hypothetical protein